MNEPFSNLPRGWARSRVDRVASVKARIGWKALTAAEYVPDGYVFLATPNIKSRAIDFGNVNYISEFRYKESPELALRVGDVLLAKDGSTLGITNVVTELPRPATVNGSVAVLRPQGIDPVFLRYVLAGGAIQSLISAVKDGMGVPHLFQSDIRRLPIPIPPARMQRAIARYLDRETALIDALIEKKQAVVERLEERETALIHELTCRGVRKADRADSGIRWLGRTPRHWEVMQIRRIANVRRGASPRPIDDPVYFDDEGDFAWVRISDVTASGRYLEQTQQRLSALGSSLSAKLAPGSLFVSIAGSVGKPMVTRIPCCVHDGFVYFERLSVRPDYLYFLFRASQLFLGLGKLGTQLNLNTSTIGSISIPVPPADEQDEIVAELDLRLSSNDAARSGGVRQIALLQERRQALITAAVTGQLDIYEAA